MAFTDHRGGSYRTIRGSPVRGDKVKLLGLDKTLRLWDRLETESRIYYGTLHSAKNQAQHIGPVRFRDIGRTFSDLEREYHRLKRRFTVMALIGRAHNIPTRNGHWENLSDLVLAMSDQVIGLGVVKTELSKLWGFEFDVRIR